MLHTWTVVGIAISLGGIISNQDSAPPVPRTVKSAAVRDAQKAPGPPAASQPEGESVYVIEMRVLEGTGLIEDGSKNYKKKSQRGPTERMRNKGASTGVPYRKRSRETEAA